MFLVILYVFQEIGHQLYIFRRNQVINLKFDVKTVNAFIPNQSRQNESTIGSANGSIYFKRSFRMKVSTKAYESIKKNKW